MKLPTLSLPRTSVTDQGPARLRALRCRRMLDPNNKIKAMQRKAYSFRDKEFFKLKILAGHEARPGSRPRQPQPSGSADDPDGGSNDAWPGWPVSAS